MRRLSDNLTLVVGLSLPAAQAILVAPGSPCSANCGNVLDSTSPDDVVCPQNYYSGATGQLFQGCVQCEMQSTYHSNNDSDVQSMLYNLRYAVSYCLFGVPDNKNVVNTPCITSKACGPFRDAIEYKNLSSKYKSFEYCDQWPVTDGLDFKGCTDCLQAAGNLYLANFVTTLQAGCAQRPAPGIFIGLDGNVFSSNQVNITAPTPTPSVNPEWFDQGPLNLGAKVGIAIGGFVFLLVILGCGIVLNGRRRRKAYLRKLEATCVQQGWPSPNAQARGDMAETPASQPAFREWDDTPLSQQPLRGWDDSPMTASPEKPFPTYFSPYSSQYNSPVSAQDGQNMQWPQGAVGRTQNIGLALGGEVSGPDVSGGHWTPSSFDGKGKAREEAYEMHEVDSAESGSSKRYVGMPRTETPVLGHPGYGRADNSPPRQYALNEHDARNGNAF
ncbi:hypothetical protein TOPH_01851 [Tolypocladium ophioglossoides CBS 100239]|uniref:Lpxtg-domain-containing protein n=1 Tax=Tolypocladium ophioglossoides (strain CBS 100239) TaxID=1163406 RepID=A0A0L0NHQ3_TOLOC|nr:hypothetical protein TOPH_01851 [Tolypocladium ophioglossoides CBS 100239]